MKKVSFSAPFYLAGAIALTTIGGVAAQTNADLKKDQDTPADVLVYGMGPQGQRYSPLTRINKDNVKRLVPKWSYSMSDTHGAEAFPLIANGMVYTTNHNTTVAVDAVTGKQVWKVTHDYPPEILRIVCCGIVNRGAAIYEGKIIRATLDNHLIAMDAKTGKIVWDVQSPNVSAETGYSMTGAPLVADGTVITGAAGAEFGIRGFLEG